MSVAVVVITVQIKHTSIFPFWKPMKVFLECAPEACKVALQSDFVEDIINKKSHELLLHFVIYGHS